MFDREAALLSCKATAVLGLVLFVLGAPVALLMRTSSGWSSGGLEMGRGITLVAVTLLVLSGLAALFLRRR
jgi:hypothetical protein